jgi:hypothetical protein
MRTKSKFNIKPTLLVLIAVMLVSYACTRVEDNTRAASLLVVEEVVGIIGGDEDESTPLLSDVCDNENDQPQDPHLCSVFNDNADVSFTNEFLQIGPGTGTGTSFLNDIIVNRYRVDYFRPNGRNTPGVDVPYGIDGTMNVRVPVDGQGEGSIIVVRHEAKGEPPLAELTNGTSEGVLTANAELRFYGQDLSGRTVSATGYLEIHFANFGEE